MRTFTVYRKEDVSGVSGTGTIAEGVEFHDGQIAISWFGQHHILEVAPTIQTWIDIHGHGGKTIIEWTPVPQMFKPGP
jgi:hypothetical protein